MCLCNMMLPVSCTITLCGGSPALLVAPGVLPTYHPLFVVSCAGVGISVCAVCELCRFFVDRFHEKNHGKKCSRCYFISRHKGSDAVFWNSSVVEQRNSLLQRHVAHLRYMRGSRALRILAEVTLLLNAKLKKKLQQLIQSETQARPD